MILLDSSVWFALGGDAQKDLGRLVDSDTLLFTSVLSLFEIKRRLLKQGKQREKIEKFLSFIRSRSMILDVTKQIADRAAELSFSHKLSTADALIYATAQERNAELLTGDTDFQGLKGVRIIK